MPKRHGVGTSKTQLVAHVEEIVLATSGEDAFEVVFAIAAARITEDPKRPLRTAIAAARKRHRTLDLAPLDDAPDDLLARVDALLKESLGRDFEALDAVFESLVPRLAKGDKGQFFTPRHVVDFVIRALVPKKNDVVIDPACGSGAFLAHARAAGVKNTHGSDVDARAVRVARLLTLASGGDPRTIVRADGLREELPVADIVATNPPFAGRAPADGFEVKDLVRTPERDVLFLERALDLLRPGGRLGIVLPYNKASGAAFANLRRWLVDRARVLAVVGLPRETFLPHTSQRTFVLFAKKRARRETPKSSEPTLLVVSERAGKDTAGDPIFKGDTLDHDLDDALAELRPFFTKERFA